MRVQRLEFADAPLALIDKLAENNFFSSTSFAKIWSSLGGNPVYWVAEGNNQVNAIIPGVEFGRGIFKRFQSMPDGCYSSILFNQSLNQNESKLALTNAIANAGYFKVFINDFHDSYHLSSDYEIEKCQTFLVNISSRQWEPIDSKLRQQIHKAERSELTLEKFYSSKHLDNFMKLVSLHEQRRNIKVNYNRKFFRDLAEISEKDERIIWIWCEHEGSAVASHIFLIEGESLLHWQMYYDEAKSDLQATKFIPFKIAKEAAEKSVRTLNLGSTPTGAEGAELYKSKWGGEEYNYNCYVRKNLLGRLL